MYFVLKDNFEKIIKKTLKNNKVLIEKIATGWTNYVFKATISNSKSYIFRFPRNTFFAKTLIKEEVFGEFVKDKISFKTPNIKLFYHKKRPFTMHDYMSGKTLTQAYEHLNDKEKRDLAKDIAKFLKELQSIKIPNGTIENSKGSLKLEKLSEFLQGLSKVHEQDYNLNEHEILLKLENNGLTLSHADFNPGNIVLDKNNKMYAVLDFAFVSYTSNIIDIARIIGRLPESYETVLIEEYQNVLNVELNKDEINELVTMWKYVEHKYIQYIKACHPDIDLPKEL